MITDNMLERYSQVTLKTLRMFSPDTVIKLLDTMSSDKAVEKMEQILSQNPTEQEVLKAVEKMEKDIP